MPGLSFDEKTRKELESGLDKDSRKISGSANLSVPEVPPKGCGRRYICAEGLPRGA